MKKFITSFFFLFLFFAFSASIVDAQVSPPEAGNANRANTVSLKNPLGSTDTPQEFIGQLISAVLGIVGSIALAMFIYGGFTWMTSAGNSEAVSKGKNIVIYAVLGLVIIFTSYALVKFVFTSIGA